MLEYSLMNGHKPYQTDMTDMTDRWTCWSVRCLDNPKHVPKETENFQENTECSSKTMIRNPMSKFRLDRMPNWQSQIIKFLPTIKQQLTSRSQRHPGHSK